MISANPILGYTFITVASAGDCGSKKALTEANTSRSNIPLTLGECCYIIMSVINLLPQSTGEAKKAQAEAVPFCSSLPLVPAEGSNIPLMLAEC